MEIQHESEKREKEKNKINRKGERKTPNSLPLQCPGIPLERFPPSYLLLKAAFVLAVGCKALFENFALIALMYVKVKAVVYCER